ncbi:VWA domain-containing protein [Candidatus Accumulibacter sp. ACC003]|uniref:vWA domain-containing protein n=1 Tax=Candidatus Accumulibacter sp. ACC003 TaxID=2823334 RepID=UPI0025C298C3|nr:VWA domain-containing protein [Candidatus Accumulibacter sp. ACC003]
MTGGETISDFVHALHFLRPQWLLALPLLWGMVLWLARRQQQLRDWAGLIDPQLLPKLRLATAGRAARSPWPWLALGWTLAAIALSGPSWQRLQTRAYDAPAAWVMVLDLSPSMTASDLAPNRITRARYALEDILASAHDARVALVVFSDEAYAVTPLTNDVTTVRALLPPLQPEILPSVGDHLAPALDEAEKLLDQPGLTDRRIVLVSDGFADPAAAMAAAARIRAHGITLSVVGVGTPGGAPLPDVDGHFSHDAQGHAQVTRLDVERLRQLAAIGGGHYADLAQLPELTAALQKSTQRVHGESSTDGVEIADWHDGGVWLLPVLLLVAAFLARRGWL